MTVHKKRRSRPGSYDRLCEDLLERRLDRKAKVVACVMIALSVLMVALVGLEGEDSPQYQETFTIALFSLSAAAFIAIGAALLGTARIIIAELEDVKRRVRALRSENDDVDTAGVDEGLDV